MLEALIVILLLLWLFGYFGRGRWYGGRGPVLTAPAGGWLASGNLVHMLLVIVVILVILRLLGVD
jgi:hypothetical protein